jgi:predicted NUDIX family NTP pyrophosphohydrolase
MAKRSAGILLYRGRGTKLELLLVHPGGPFWAKKDEGAWSIPKGLADAGEDLLAAAQREFHEETGFTAEGDFTPLGTFKQPGGKIVHAWAVEGDLDPADAHSNEIEIEWPPRSGRRKRFPEIDRVAWFGPIEARRRIKPTQAPLIDRLEEALGG